MLGDTSLREELKTGHVRLEPMLSPLCKSWRSCNNHLLTKIGWWRRQEVTGCFSQKTCNDSAHLRRRSDGTARTSSWLASHVFKTVSLGVSIWRSSKGRMQTGQLFHMEARMTNLNTVTGMTSEACRARDSTARLIWICTLGLAVCTSPSTLARPGRHNHW